MDLSPGNLGDPQGEGIMRWGGDIWRTRREVVKIGVRSRYRNGHGFRQPEPGVAAGQLITTVTVSY
jgi:hypothetical protein